MSGERRILFRADASPETGTGHVIRCRTLATELVQRGWAVTLASRGLPPGLAPSIRLAGISIIDLPPDQAIIDEPDHLESRTSGPVSAIVVDHYGIDAEWERAGARWAGVIMSIDDLADRFQEVDLLLNQNMGASDSRYRGLVPPRARVLSGPHYALVDPAFAAAHRRARVRDGRVGRILVFISGTDPHDVTRKAAMAAATAGIPVDVVVAATYPFAARLQAWAADEPLVAVHVDTRGVASLMERADLAIGAPGSASWERCSVGLPTVLLTIADNQVENARLLAEAGAAVSLGSPASLTVRDIATALTELVGDRALVALMSETAARITDGNGTARVADALERLVADVGWRRPG